MGSERRVKQPTSEKTEVEMVLRVQSESSNGRARTGRGLWLAPTLEWELERRARDRHTCM